MIKRTEMWVLGLLALCWVTAISCGESVTRTPDSARNDRACQTC